MNIFPTTPFCYLVAPTDSQFFLSTKGRPRRKRLVTTGMFPKTILFQCNNLAWIKWYKTVQVRIWSSLIKKNSFWSGSLLAVMLRTHFSRLYFGLVLGHNVLFISCSASSHNKKHAGLRTLGLRQRCACNWRQLMNVHQTAITLFYRLHCLQCSMSHKLLLNGKL